ncbi:MAG TPA: Na/Pi cotransporter family protein [Cerasibacillus sp.]|uniref:Na/Pi cotransporter family protein n=1 Tax=Cerasibacillus sp. TaxID=2498711 RepID=UPI002F402A57
MTVLWQSFLGFIGGLGIFLYGTHLLSNGLQRLAASKMREYLTKLTDTRMKALFSGIVTTFLLQSSTVTSIILVGLVSSSAIGLSQAFGVVLGSAIGTTFTVQILTFDISMYSSVFIFLGVIFIIFVRHNRWNTTGVILLSIGFIFFGIHLISSSLEPLSKEQQLLDVLLNISDMPIAFAFISMILTAIFHSSAAMIIIGIAFVSNGVLTVEAIIPLVLGANVGSTIPVLLSSATSNRKGKKLAVFYFSFKLIGVVIAFLGLNFLLPYLGLIPGSPERQIAHFHTLFNLGIAFLFLPFLPAIAKLFKKLAPLQEEEVTFQVELDQNLIIVPEEALYQSKKEISRLAQMVQNDMLKRLGDYIDGRLDKQSLYRVEMLIDASYIKIQQFLLKLAQQNLTDEQSNLEVQLLNILNDIEHIGDTVVRFIGVAEKVSQKNILLGQRDFEKIKQLLHYIEKTFDDSITAFAKNDLQLAKDVLQYQAAIDQFEKDVKFEHFNRLIDKEVHDPDISAVYLDMINQLLHVYHHAMNISRTVLGLI